MIRKLQAEQALQNIYIAPLENCNLNCQLCYTKKSSIFLENEKILAFLTRYKKHVDLKSIIFCGGEVFLLPNFTSLINQLLSQKIFITVITNGTIDKLSEITDSKNCQLLVSLDGPKEIHDNNRGEGNFQKSVSFIKWAISLNFPVEIMFLVTPQSYFLKDSFPTYIEEVIGKKVPLSYITQKTFYFTENHPLSNQNNEIIALTKEQIIDIKQNYPSIPKKSFGCFQLSLQSNGLIYGCCESPFHLGKVTDSIGKIIENFKNSLTTCARCQKNFCHGCCVPEFICGYARELGVKNCQEVVKLLGQK